MYFHFVSSYIDRDFLFTSLKVDISCVPSTTNQGTVELVVTISALRSNALQSQSHELKSVDAALQLIHLIANNKFTFENEVVFWLTI